MQSVADASRLENNLSPQWDVPVELIELQPAYEQTRWTGDWAHTTSTKVEFLMKKLRKLRTNSCENEFLNQRAGSSYAASTSTAATKPSKVIVFSRFYVHLLLIREELLHHQFSFAIFFGSSTKEKVSELQRFKDDPDVQVLLLCSGGRPRRQRRGSRLPRAGTSRPRQVFRLRQLQGSVP